jgi:hypothetical protein
MGDRLGTQGAVGFLQFSRRNFGLKNDVEQK